MPKEQLTKIRARSAQSMRCDEGDSHMLRYKSTSSSSLNSHIRFKSPAISSSAPTPMCACARSCLNQRKRIHRSYSSLGFKNFGDSDRKWQSNLSLKCDCLTNPLTCGQKYQLANFQRCIKLLGLNLDLAEDKKNDKSGTTEETTSRLDLRNVKPKTVTRLTHKTISKEQVEEAILKDFESLSYFDDDDLERRELLAKAVYERWYFNKLEELKKQKERLSACERELQTQCEQLRTEQKLKADKSYREWLEKKKKTGAFSQSPKSNVDNKGSKYRSQQRRFLQKDATQAFEQWKAKKDEQMKQKHLEIAKERRKTEEKELRLREAEKAYLSWKNRITEKMKEKMEEERKKRKEKLEEENRMKVEKEREADMSFNAWKHKKMNKRIQEEEMKRQSREQMMESRTERLSQRLWEAEQAFLKWLDAIDQRLSTKHNSSQNLLYG